MKSQSLIFKLFEILEASLSEFGLESTVKRFAYISLLSTLGPVLRQPFADVNGSKIYLIPGDTGISRELKVFKIHEPLATATLESHLDETPQRDLYVLDIGSNIGYYTLLEAKGNPRGRIIAIEPNPVAFQYLKKNIQANALDNVIAKNTAIWNKDGCIEFVVRPVSNLCYVKEVGTGEAHTGSVIEVPTRTRLWDIIILVGF